MDRAEMLEQIGKITEFNDLSDFMKDEELDYLLASVVKLIAKEDLSPQVAIFLIVRLQALSTKMGILAGYYSNIEKGPAGSIQSKKKNTYYNVNEKINSLVDALKIYVRYA